MGKITNVNIYTPKPDLLSEPVTHRKMITSKNLSVPKKLLEKRQKLEVRETDTSMLLHISPLIRTPNYEGVNERNYSMIRDQITRLKPGEIDLLVRDENTRRVKQSLTKRYNKIEKCKIDTFSKLQNKLDEPLLLSSMKCKRRKNNSQSIKAKLSGNTSPAKNGASSNKKSIRMSKELRSKIQLRQRSKMIDRIELDRPILLAGKMDILWTKPTELLPEINIVRYQIEVSLYGSWSCRKRNLSEWRTISDSG